MAAERARIGIIGFGYIGSYVYEQVTTRPELGMDVAFVYNRTAKRISDVPEEVILKDLGDFASRQADLIVELAHPDITRDYGVEFLKTADYMPMSLTVFADAEIDARLRDAADSSGTSIYIPHGAIVGLEALEEGRQMWEEVSIVMKKPPRSLDFANAPQFDPTAIDSETILFEGSTRDICPLFPRNVNSHAAVALGGIGFDDTRSVLIADPALETSIIDVEARGRGVEIKVRRENPMVGVSGVFTLVACLASIGRACAPGSGLRIC